MFKKIPGSTLYRINLNGEIIDECGEVVKVDVNGKGEITITLFGLRTLVDLKRLILLAWYEVSDLQNLNEILDQISFLPATSKILRVSCGYLMIFKKPIYFREGYRIIPNYPQYAIDKRGHLIDTRTNSLVTTTEDSDGYVSVYIRSPDKCMNRTIRLHRLLAMAWLDNADFIDRPYVNHKDGNKKNYDLGNLEWCSQSENAQHALQTGLTDTSKAMKSRNVQTGEVVVYSSCADMARTLGTTSSAPANYTNKLPGYLHKGRFEIKVFEDQSPWYYENQTLGWVEGDPVKAVYSITVLNKQSGSIRTFTNVKLFCKEYQIKLPSVNIEKACLIFNERYPMLELTVKRNATQGPYQVYDRIECKTFIVDSIQHIADITGMHRSGLQYDLCRGLKYIYLKRWLISAGLKKLDPDLYIEKPQIHRQVQAFRDSSADSRTFPSLKACAKGIGLDYKSVTKCLRTGISIKGWNIRALDQ